MTMTLDAPTPAPHDATPILEARDLIRAQAFGEALNPHRLERLARYEVHLDRKLERILSMLLKLQELRRTITPNAAA